jgi:thymidine phosphorylase
MQDLEGYRLLARTMVDIGARHGVKTVALITWMGQPLGREVGNANEMRESIEVLRGNGPEDVLELTLALGEVMMELAGIGGGRDVLLEAIDSGKALQKLVDVVIAQGGDPAYVEDPGLLPACTYEEEIRSPATGYVTRCDALTIGVVATRLGAGRERKEDAVDPGVGITLEAKVGDRVEAAGRPRWAPSPRPGRSSPPRHLHSPWSWSGSTRRPEANFEHLLKSGISRYHRHPQVPPRSPGMKVRG